MSIELLWMGLIVILLGILQFIRMKMSMKHSKIVQSKIEWFNEQVNDDGQLVYIPVVLYYDDEEKKYFAYTGPLNPFKIKVGNTFELRVIKRRKNRKAYLNKWWINYFIPNIIITIGLFIIISAFFN